VGGGAQGPLMQTWNPHIISETTWARKLKLKTQIGYVVKYTRFGYNNFPLGGVQAAQGLLM